MKQTHRQTPTDTDRGHHSEYIHCTRMSPGSGNVGDSPRQGLVRPSIGCKASDSDCTVPDPGCKQLDLRSIATQPGSAALESSGQVSHLRNLASDLDNTVSGSCSKIWAISDLHVDYPQNEAFVERWSNRKYQQDTLIVAGDVTDNIELLKVTLQTLTKKFRDVFFVPGKALHWIG